MDELIKLFEKLSSGELERQVNRALIELETQFLDLQKNQWYNQGKDSEGKDLGDYSPGYARRRQRAGLRTDHVTLKFTGKFFASLRLVMKSDGVYIESQGVSYEKHIVKRYGVDIYDLNDQQRAKMVPVLVAEILKNLRKYLRL